MGCSASTSDDDGADARRAERRKRRGLTDTENDGGLSYTPSSTTGIMGIGGGGGGQKSSALCSLRDSVSLDAYHGILIDEDVIPPYESLLPIDEQLSLARAIKVSSYHMNPLVQYPSLSSFYSPFSPTGQQQQGQPGQTHPPQLVHTAPTVPSSHRVSGGGKSSNLDFSVTSVSSSSQATNSTVGGPDNSVNSVTSPISTSDASSGSLDQGKKSSSGACPISPYDEQPPTSILKASGTNPTLLSSLMMQGGNSSSSAFTPPSVFQDERTNESNSNLSSGVHEAMELSHLSFAMGTPRITVTNPPESSSPPLPPGAAPSPTRMEASSSTMNGSLFCPKSPQTQGNLSTISMPLLPGEVDVEDTDRPPGMFGGGRAFLPTAGVKRGGAPLVVVSPQATQQQQLSSSRQGAMPTFARLSVLANSSSTSMGSAFTALTPKVGEDNSTSVLSINNVQMSSFSASACNTNTTTPILSAGSPSGATAGPGAPPVADSMQMASLRSGGESTHSSQSSSGNQQWNTSFTGSVQPRFQQIDESPNQSLTSPVVCPQSSGYSSQRSPRRKNRFISFSRVVNTIPFYQEHLVGSTEIRYSAPPGATFSPQKTDADSGGGGGGVESGLLIPRSSGSTVNTSSSLERGREDPLAVGAPPPGGASSSPLLGATRSFPIPSSSINTVPGMASSPFTTGTMSPVSEKLLVPNMLLSPRGANPYQTLTHSLEEEEEEEDSSALAEEASLVDLVPVGSEE